MRLNQFVCPQIMPNHFMSRAMFTVQKPKQTTTDKEGEEGSYAILQCMGCEGIFPAKRGKKCNSQVINARKRHIENCSANVDESAKKKAKLEPVTKYRDGTITSGKKRPSVCCSHFARVLPPSTTPQGSIGISHSPFLFFWDTIFCTPLRRILMKDRHFIA